VYAESVHLWCCRIAVGEHHDKKSFGIPEIVLYGTSRKSVERGSIVFELLMLHAHFSHRRRYRIRCSIERVQNSLKAIGCLRPQ